MANQDRNCQNDEQSHESCDFCVSCFASVLRQTPQDDWFLSRVYRVRKCQNICLTSARWKLREQIRLLDMIQRYNVGNWKQVFFKMNGAQSPAVDQKFYMGHFQKYFYQACCLQSQQLSQVINSSTRTNALLKLSEMPLKYRKMRFSVGLPKCLASKPQTQIRQPQSAQQCDSIMSYFQRKDQEQNLSQTSNVSNHYRQLNQTTIQDASSQQRASLPTMRTMTQDYSQTVKAAYNQFRDQFDLQYEYSAEYLICDIQFREQDTEQETALKLALVKQYNRKLRERIKRKKHLKQHDLIAGSTATSQANLAQAINPKGLIFGIPDSRYPKGQTNKSRNEDLLSEKNILKVISPFLKYLSKAEKQQIIRQSQQIDALQLLSSRLQKYRRSVGRHNLKNLTFEKILKTNRKRKLSQQDLQKKYLSVALQQEQLLNEQQVMYRDQSRHIFSRKAAIRDEKFGQLKFSLPNFTLVQKQFVQACNQESYYEQTENEQSKTYYTRIAKKMKSSTEKKHLQKNKLRRIEYSQSKGFKRIFADFFSQSVINQQPFSQQLANQLSVSNQQSAICQSAACQMSAQDQ